mgnify:CR=1 FL=1
MTDKLSRLLELMRQHDFDAAAINPGPTFTYLTGMRMHLMERPTVLLGARSGLAALVLFGMGFVILWAVLRFVFRIPSLITRRAQTDVELRDGQSFAVAGLLSPLLAAVVTNRPAEHLVLGLQGG